MSTTQIVSQIKAARRVSAPLIAINTPDPAATIRAVCEGINGNAVKLQWDVVNGLQPLTENAETVLADIKGEGYDATVGDPCAALTVAQKLPELSVYFIHNAPRFMGEPSVVQAAWNLRESFKSNGRTLIMLGVDFQLPAELQQDVLLLDEPLPNAEELAAIVREQYDSADLEADDATVARAVEAVQGLAAFPAEQVTAMSLRREGLDVDALWERKRQMIEQTPGLKVSRGGETFADIGGVQNAKDFLGRVMKGNARPNAVVFIDEIEKAMAGTTGDTSGVSQDQLGVLLSYMQDNAAAGCIFVGPPGSAKSAVAKAAGNEGGVPTIQLDLGAAKGSLVGQSEAQLRQALKVVSSVSNGQSLWIATCNSIGTLPPELRRRFNLGIFFYDFPSAEERATIWDIWVAKFGLDFETVGERPDDSGWTGAEIKQACDIAWRLGCTLVEAAEFVVPVSRSAGDQIQKLREQASGRFLSASHRGVYKYECQRYGVRSGCERQEDSAQTPVDGLRTSREPALSTQGRLRGVFRLVTLGANAMSEHEMNERMKQCFPGLSDQECKSAHAVFLEDGRRFNVPSVLYDHIREGGFSHGILWRDAHPREMVKS